MEKRKIAYPNGHKGHYQEKKVSTADRGMTLENDINTTNSYYLDSDIAVVYKKPTPVTIVNVDYPKRSAAKITEAYFKVPSTTDYNGIYKNRYIDFEAKECSSKTSFPLSSIHDHQIKHLESVYRHGAICFLIVRFTAYDETYYVDAYTFIKYINSVDRKSVPYKWFQENGQLIAYNYLKPVDYISIIDRLYFED